MVGPCDLYVAYNCWNFFVLVESMDNILLLRAGTWRQWSMRGSIAMVTQKWDRRQCTWCGGFYLATFAWLVSTTKVYEVIVMKDYGIVECWTPLFEILNLTFFEFYPNWNLIPLMRVENGHVLIVNGGLMFSYNFQTVEYNHDYPVVSNWCTQKFKLPGSAKADRRTVGPWIRRGIFQISIRKKRNAQ